MISIVQLPRMLVLFTMIQEYLQAYRSEAVGISEERMAERLADAGNDASMNQYLWGGRFHCVPEGFRFPNTNIKTLWDLWLFGNRALGIAPYRYIIPKFDLMTKGEVVNYSRVKYVITVILKKCEELGFGSVTRIAALSPGACDEAFDSAFKSVVDVGDLISSHSRVALCDFVQNDQTTT